MHLAYLSLGIEPMTPAHAPVRNIEQTLLSRRGLDARLVSLEQIQHHVQTANGGCFSSDPPFEGTTSTSVSADAILV